MLSRQGVGLRKTKVSFGANIMGVVRSHGPSPDSAARFYRHCVQPQVITIKKFCKFFLQGVDFGGACMKIFEKYEVGEDGFGLWTWEAEPVGIQGDDDDNGGRVEVLNRGQNFIRQV